jgi:hypothetical protein
MFLVFSHPKNCVQNQEYQIHAKDENGVKSANPVFKILYTPSKTQRNSPLIIEKMA